MMPPSRRFQRVDPFCVAALLCAALLGAPASATEKSQALTARALIEIDAGRTSEARALLDEAIAADPSDAEARYLRGMLLGQGGNYAGAIDDLRAALASRPKFDRAALELGVALTESGRYEEAIAPLTQAQQDPALAAQASFYLGLVQLRLDKLDAAQASFAKARTGDPALAQSAQYYEGVIAFRRNRLDDAEVSFVAVRSAQPDSAIGREADQFLELIKRTRRASYTVFGTVALEYDSNVTLGPDADTAVAAGISGEGDGRVVLNAGGRYVPLRYGSFSLSLGYEFFQSLQFDLTEFNLQDHRPAIQLQFDIDRVSFGVLGRYDYYLLDTSSFMQETTAFPWVTVREPGLGQTEVYARLQWRDYYQADFDVLSGYYNNFGVRQVFDLGARGRRLWIGYQLGFSDPSRTLEELTGDTVTGPDNFEDDPEAYQYGANQFEIALRWPLPYEVVGEVGYRYEIQNYGPQSAWFPPPDPVDTDVVPRGGNRVDNDHRVLVSFERPIVELSEHLFVVASWFGTWNNSNKTLFEYTRQIGSLAAEVRF